MSKSESKDCQENESSPTYGNPANEEHTYTHVYEEKGSESSA